MYKSNFDTLFIGLHYYVHFKCAKKTYFEEIGHKIGFTSLVFEKIIQSSLFQRNIYARNKISPLDVCIVLYFENDIIFKIFYNCI